ncbi:adenylyl-sulfate kinase [Candidatus Dojkabacteria bacterium]|jgi:adenylylsulfate kinase|nr:adenylyl-sulfate kinase [Candidatus Dojkabacteria bacterium]
MIYWIYGQSGAGKTTLANKLEGIHLDADEIRPAICEDLGYTEEDRKKNNSRIARLAKLLDNQGYDVVVSTICPYEDLRDEVYYICKCRFIKVEGKYEQ